MSPRGSESLRARPGFIQCYGLFWFADEIEWSGRDFRLLGRRGRSGRLLRVCDFRNQTGLYVLYDDWGPYYVGLARNQPLGKRIRDHFADHHRGNWDRFSWFGFRRVRDSTYTDGTQSLAPPPANLFTSTRDTIADVEALLIQALGTHKRANRREMRFGLAERWQQVLEHEREKYLGTVAHLKPGRIRPETLRGFRQNVGR